MSHPLEKLQQCQQIDTEQVHTCRQTAMRQELHYDGMLGGSMHTRPFEVSL